MTANVCGKEHQAYLAGRLEGPWRGLADSLAKSFGAWEDVQQSSQWTAGISHGERIRTGVDELMEVDQENLGLLFQGVSQPNYCGAKYCGILWRLG